MSQREIKLFKRSGRTEYVKAGWIMVAPGRMVENGILGIANGRVTGVHTGGIKDKVIDLGPGVIMPVLVNAHAHLELSGLFRALSYAGGFTAWVGDLLAKRDALGEAELTRKADEAAGCLAREGTGIIGEISTLGITQRLMAKHGLAGVWFRECLGSELPKLPDLGRDGFSAFSVAGHAPHTTHPDLLLRLKNAARGKALPFSIHLAESRAESEFIQNRKGEWADFMVSRGIDTRDWPIGNKSPVQYMDALGLLDPGTLAVHLLRVNGPDLEILRKSGVRICICPRSNQNLHQHLPPLTEMLAHGLAPALGTDSLASCDSLNLFDEMAFVREHYPGVTPEAVLAMATRNGAAALGLENEFGTLAPGRQAWFLYADILCTTQHQLMERLTTHA